jgi:galactose mutarotase-like enzyme
MTDDIHRIQMGGITAAIKADGAELCSLKTASGGELLWQAGPAWPRHAPWLFPIVGRLMHDELHHRGRTYEMTQHGFARDLRFEWLTDGAVLHAATHRQRRDAGALSLRFPPDHQLSHRGGRPGGCHRDRQSRH